ncbi:phosphoribosylanthranilate isomerase [Pseudoxanthomonas sp.]|uniref:phosphoribosylanthranilate isomerase n=1 Tax=Pseudoxanthomonas sp. TaxID=1871049 RepID=UPI00260B02C2|nr:phosphoribosylanthranilate isomerase [Pseudoxanthomonas sp.]WDS36463.1 MAG: phosphoribosylanthranilate isomerase [Pseudoxanthomonas sp.]
MHTRIKLCGMTRPQDVRLAVELGVDYIGLIFARSPRQLGIEQAIALRSLIPDSIGAVALVMDQSADAVAAIAAQVQPDLLQFHGNEDDAFCAGFGLPFLKALPMGGALQAEAAMAGFPSAWGFILDSHVPGGAGGSGKSFDWARYPHDAARPCMLAGGLTAETVGAAITAARPWGVDVSSGIESAPGHKDHQAMRRFVAAVRAAEASPKAGAVV